MEVQALRGAVRVEVNTSVCKSVQKLLLTILAENAIQEEDIISIQFTLTRDLTTNNPARCLREIGFQYVPLFCSQEPEYEGSLDRVIRVLITYYTHSRKKRPRPVYLGGAEILREDLK